MQVLVSFCNTKVPEIPALGLLDATTSDFEVLKLPAGLPPLCGITGLATCGEFIYVVPQPFCDSQGQSQPFLLVFDRTNFTLRNHYDFRVAADVHSICACDGSLYVVSTGTDEVVALGLKGGSVLSESVFWRPASGGPREDLSHLNAIINREGNLLVSGFGPKAGPLWSSANQGFIFNITQQEKIADGLDQPHSLAWLDGTLAYCESRKKAVRALDGSRIQYLPGYTRGLCKVGRNLFVGTSIGRQVSKSTGLINNPVDPGAYAGECGVFQLSADKFAIEKIFKLGEGAQEIYDLLPIEGTGAWPRVPGLIWRDAGLGGLVVALDGQTGRAKQLTEALAARDASLRDLQIQKERLAEALAQKERDLQNLRLHVAEQAAQSRELAALQPVIEDFQQTFRDEVRAQLGELRGFLADRDALFFAAMKGLQRRGTGEEWADLATSTLGGPAAKKRFDGQRYQEMIDRVRQLVACTLPANAKIAVVSKGDPRLLQLEGRQGLHFPQQDNGTYAGFHPKDSAAAVEALNRIRAKGAEFLLFPATALWWLEHYKEFAAHLSSRARVLARDEQTCVIFALQQESVREPLTGFANGPEYAPLVRQLRGVVDSILPPDSRVLVLSNGDAGLLELGRRVAFHFPQDANGSHPVDSAAAIAQLEELRRTGAHFFVVPKSAWCWFDHHQEFGRYLETKYRAIVRQRHVCTIFDLNGR